MDIFGKPSNGSITDGLEEKSIETALNDSEQYICLGVRTDDYRLRVPVIDTNKGPVDFSLRYRNVFEAVLSEKEILKLFLIELFDRRIKVLDIVAEHQVTSGVENQDRNIVQVSASCLFELTEERFIVGLQIVDSQAIERSRICQSLLDVLWNKVDSVGNCELADIYVITFCSDESMPDTKLVALQGRTSFGAKLDSLHKDDIKGPGDGRRTYFFNYSKLKDGVNSALSTIAHYLCDLPDKSTEIGELIAQRMDVLCREQKVVDDMLTIKQREEDYKRGVTQGMKMENETWIKLLYSAGISEDKVQDILNRKEKLLNS